MEVAKILIVDDAHDFLELRRAFLERSGYEVVPAENGQIGLDLFGQINPDLVLSDYSMPVMDGLEMAKLIRQICPEAKIIISSGYFDLEKPVKKAGYSFFLKGEDPAGLLVLIKSLLTG